MESQKVVTNLHFQVDGEYICRVARSWFWEENKPFEKCEELLLACLESDEVSIEERKNIVIEILEGRKKLVGINTVELVEDGECIRPLYKKLDEYRKKEMIRKISEDIELRPIAYIDRFSCPNNPDEFEPVKNLRYQDRREIEAEYGRSISPYTEVLMWAYSTYKPIIRTSFLEDGFWNTDARPYLENGFYLIDRPSLVYELIGEPVSDCNIDRLYEGLYEYLEKILLIENIPDKRKNEIRIRNNKYIASIRNEFKEPDQETGSENNDDDLNEMVEPDNYLSEYGLIDRSGNYYSCGFAGHHAKAYHIVMNDMKRFKERHPEIERIKRDECLDILYSEGWAIIRNPDPGGYVFFDYRFYQQPTKRQIDAAFDHIVKFEERTLPGIEKYME